MKCMRSVKELKIEIMMKKIPKTGEMKMDRTTIIRGKKEENLRKKCL